MRRIFIAVLDPLPSIAVYGDSTPISQTISLFPEPIFIKDKQEPDANHESTMLNAQVPFVVT